MAWARAFYALAQQLKPGDRILTGIVEYGANYVAMLQVKVLKTLPHHFQYFYVCKIRWFRWFDGHPPPTKCVLTYQFERNASHREMLLLRLLGPGVFIINPTTPSHTLQPCGSNTDTLATYSRNIATNTCKQAFKVSLEQSLAPSS